MYQDSQLVLKKDVPTGRAAWRSPSNIALVKYWGKHGNQLPKNPSVSLTLSESYSETSVSYRPRSAADAGAFSFLFDAKEEPAFADRIGKYLTELQPIFPFLDQLHLDIRSRNSFPHSSGIASSASAFSALALCLCSMEHQCFNTLDDDKAFRKKASYVARLGSGSASRSIFATAALWGQYGEEPESSDEFAIGVKDQLHETFQSYGNAILLVDSGSKSVSSSAGHRLMEDHVFAQVRYSEARKNLLQLMQALHSGDTERAGLLIEVEAMQLHAMMMASRPYVILLAPNTLKIIHLIQEFRKSTKLPVYFTIDAGPNLHLLYPQENRSDVVAFIEDVLVQYCLRGSWIDDRVGNGPVQID